MLQVVTVAASLRGSGARAEQVHGRLRNQTASGTYPLCGFGQLPNIPELLGLLNEGEIADRVVKLGTGWPTSAQVNIIASCITCF